MVGFTGLLVAGTVLILSAGLAIGDDTAELQDEVNAAIANHQPLALHARTYTISSTISARPPAGTPFLTGFAIRGAGVGNSVIQWAGPANASVFQITAAKSAVIHDFQVTGQPALVDMDFAGGGSSNNVEVDRVVMDNGPDFGVRLGNPNDLTQVSEFSFRNVAIAPAGIAAFQLEGNNTLNINFYNCSCGSAKICVSNDGLLEKRIGNPPVANGGNFNWFGGSVSDAPLGQTDPDAGTFVLAEGGSYTFSGVRVEDTSTLFNIPGPTGAPVNVMWFGGQMLMGQKPQNQNAKIIKYYAGGSFVSQGSLWAGKGTFDFSGGPAKHVIFEGDGFGVGGFWNSTMREYFALTPSGLHPRLSSLYCFAP
jgi:hypothetical protein